MSFLCMVMLTTLIVLAAAVASENSSAQVLQSDEVPSLGSLAGLQGYPGTLSIGAVEEAVNIEIRNQILTLARASRFKFNTTQPKQRRHLKKSSGSDDFSNLNDILKTFVIPINEQTFMTDVLGVTATVTVLGECGSITIDDINLDYVKSGSSLTYIIEVEGLDLKCQLEVDWDLGVLDVSDMLKIRIVLTDNNFEIALTLQGSPPDSSSFNGCEAEINVASISSQGGFSSDILNELSDLTVEIVNNEAEVISDLLCEQIASFTATIDELLVTLGDTLAPYLTQVADADPLELEKNLEVDVALVDFTDSTIGEVIQVFIDNLQGVVGAFQINTLIELNLLNEKGGFILDLSTLAVRRLQDDSTETCNIIRNRYLKNSSPYEDLGRKLKETVEAEMGALLAPLLPTALERQLQIIDFPPENLFVFGGIEFGRMEIVGLNTFQDTQFLEIIGKQTFRSELELTGLGIRVNFTLAGAINEQPIRENIQVTVHINGVFVTASFLVGLDEKKFDDLTIGRLLDSGSSNALPCILSTLVAVGLSELDVTVTEVEAPTVEGVLDTGVDNLINKAVEAVFCTYQDLILTAVPNIAQNNVTLIINDFLECYVRTEAAAAVCPEGTDSILEATGVFTEEEGGGDGLFGGTEGAINGESQQTFDFSNSIGESSFGGITYTLDGEDQVTKIITGSASSSGVAGSVEQKKTAIVYPSPSPQGSSWNNSKGFTQGLSTTDFSSTSGSSTTDAFVEKSSSFVGSGTASIQSGATSAGADGRIDGFLDFRDLLLPANEALRLGGSGSQPYGNLISMAFSLMSDQLMSVVNTTGLPSINANLLQPLTAAQSGIAGLLRFPEQLFNASIDTSAYKSLQLLLQCIKISAYDARIDNLDTVVSPFTLFQPTTQAHVLENILNFGPVDGRPLNMSIRLSFDLQGFDSPIAMSNEIDINAMAVELDLFTNIRILIPTKQFLNFPLTDILNINCWLSLLQADVMDLDGGNKIKNAVGIKVFLLKIASMAVDVKCLNCTSSSLPQVFELFQRLGATELLGKRLGLLLQDVLTSDFAPSFLTDFLRLGEEAARLCPHSPAYNTTRNKTPELSMVLPALSNRSIDTVVFVSILGAEAGAVVISESILQNGFKPSEAEAGREFEGTSSIEAGNMLNWMKLNESSIPFAGDILVLTGEYLGSQADGSGNLGVNQFLQKIIGGDGSWNINFDDLAFEFAGVVITVHAMNIAGLDSFVQFDIMEPVTPQTLQNLAHIDTLSLQVDFSINATSNSDPPQQYTVSADLRDIRADVLIYTAIDMNKVEALEFASLMWIDNILPCLLSTSSDIHLVSMQVTIGNISNPVIKGLQYETSKVISDTIESLFNIFGSNMIDAVNMAFNTPLRSILNSYLSSIISNSSCPKATGYTRGESQGSSTANAIIDFRDLLLPPDNARSLGGSGTQPYGDLFPMLFDMLQSNIQKSAEDGLLEVNSIFIDPLTESQSGAKGLLQFKNELFTRALSFLPGNALTWLKEQFTTSIFNARINNINTIVGPLSILQPSHRAHVLENMLNIGPVLSRSLNATLGISVELNGSLPLLNMQNKFDVSLHLKAVDIFADIGFRVIQERLFRFPIRDILEVPCWLSLIGMPNTNDTRKTPNGLEIKTLLINLVELYLDLTCIDCTNEILPDLVQILNVAGVSQVLGNRAGPLLQEIATSSLVASLVEDFITIGDKAAKMCPHDPLFGQEPANSTEVEPSFVLPPISGLSLDTILFAAVIAAEAAAVVIADNHIRILGQESPELQTKTLPVVPGGGNLIDWTNLNDTHIPFIWQMFGFVQENLNSMGPQDLAINSLLSSILGEGGVLEIPLDSYSFTEIGVQLTFHHLEVRGLTSFSRFQVLNPTSPQTISNDMSMDELMIGLNISVDVLESSEPPKYINFSMKLANVDVSVPMYVAINEDTLGSIGIGSLFHSSNIMPCILSSARGTRMDEMVVSVGSIAGPNIEGFLPDSRNAINNLVGNVVDMFGGTITQSLPQIFNGTVRVILNSFLSRMENLECQTFSTDNVSSFVDFREMFAAFNKSASNPYGDFIPLVMGILKAELLFVNPETKMPKINDAIIVPLTRAQSGIAGSLTMPKELLSYSFQGLKDIGLDEITFKLFDVNVENLDTIGAPLEIFEPNITSGVLLDNRATFGTELRPLRLAVKSNLFLSGSLLDSQDTIELFGEFLGLPFFVIFLARIGAQELLTFPLRYVMDIPCWFATLATPTLEAIGRGETDIDPAFAIHYVEMLFSSLRIGATCYNCTNPGLGVLPSLLDILEESGAKNVLGRRSLEFGIEFLESDFSQVWILRFLQDSMRTCPLTVDMKENSILVASPPFPTTSLQWLETAAFATLILIQSGAVILAETISALSLGAKPIFDNPGPQYPPETHLVNFTALDTYPVGSLVKYFITGANNYLGEPSNDPETGETSLGINKLLGDNPILPLDSFSMEFEDLEFHFSNIKASLKSIRIKGLDTFTKFHVMDIVGATQLKNELAWKMLQIELLLEIQLNQAQESQEDGEKQAFVIVLEAVDIETSLELMLALDYELVKNLQLGSLLHMTHILPCIQATIRHLEISNVEMDVGQISKLRVSGLKTLETSKAAEMFERLLLEDFGKSLARAVPALFNVAVKPLLNTAITAYLRDSDFKCNEFSFELDSAGFVDFRDLLLSPTQSKRFGGSGEAQYGDLIRTAYGILQVQLLTAHPENGIEMLSSVLGTLSFPGVLLNQGMRFNVKDINADITFRVSDLAIMNLDSIGRPLSILAPIKNEVHQLNNTGTFGIGNRPIRIATRIYMHVKGMTEEDIINDFDLRLDIYAATIVLTVLLKVSEMAFVQFPIRDMLNMNCWLALIPPPSLDIHGLREQGSELTAALTSLGITSTKMNLNLHCHNCTSPALMEFADMMSSQESQEEMTGLINRMLDFAFNKLGGPFLQDQINRILVEAPKHCGHTSVYDSEANPTAYEMLGVGAQASSSSYVPMLITIFLPFILSAVIALLVKWLVLQRHKKWLKVLPSEQIFLIQQKQEQQEQEETAVNKLSSSMYTSKEIPYIWRQLVPIIVVANIGFFLSGHLNLGGRILVKFAVAGESFTIDDLFVFSIGQSTVDMWHAGGKELAVLILLFSGVWPYTKQLITLALWFLPPAVVSCTRRGHFLLWLDILAKWSIVDIFVMLITVAGFRISIQSPSLAFLPNSFYSINLLVVPMWGLYANMIAQLISQISSHFIVHYHRRIIESAKKEYVRQQRIKAVLPADKISAKGNTVPSMTNEEKRDRLCRHSFLAQHCVASEKLKVHRCMNYVMLWGSIMMSVLLAVSCDIPSLKLEALGLVALMIELGQDLKQAVRYESVFSMAQLLIEQAEFLGGIRNYIGLGTLASLFVLTVLVVPITLILMLLCHWFALLSPKQRNKVATFVEILQAWQYVEVYILAIIIESWQLGTISKLMLNHFCSSLEFTLNLLVYYGILEEGDAQCFALEASIMVGAYLFVPLTCGLALLDSFVMKAYIQHLREKHDENDMPSEDEKLRAFDRTRWDSRKEAINNIRNPPVLFSDTFRWILRGDAYARFSSLWNKKSAARDAQSLEVETMLLAKTFGSDEEHGLDASSTMESVKSAESTIEECKIDDDSTTNVDS